MCIVLAKLILHLLGLILVGGEVTKDVDITEILTQSFQNAIMRRYYR